MTPWLVDTFTCKFDSRWVVCSGLQGAQQATVAVIQVPQTAAGLDTAEETAPPPRQLGIHWALRRRLKRFRQPDTTNNLHF